MIYDKPVLIGELPAGVGTPLQGKLTLVMAAFCGERSVYSSRYWDSVQAGSRIDRLVELPLHRQIEAGMYALYKDHFYSVEQAQFEHDRNGLPVTVLSLKRSEDQYDIAGV